MYIYPSIYSEFIYGNCAPLAISQFFNVSYKFTEQLFYLIGANPNKGVDIFQVKKIIKLLSSARTSKNLIHKVHYYKNTEKLDLESFCEKHKTGKFLLNLPEHIVYGCDGDIYDSFLSGGNIRNISKDKLKILSYWL